ncbi:hypothetical protein G5I_12883 [Acromyrmex echinatior]|uniref:Uncharacterized protein n=1 Tax=Acromyrmex echinatior TaxID=103372 RepID=F4X3D7_ACREC|nr:hypothetical protein G5I_12883 [Acromyrmex echinatior]
MKGDNRQEGPREKTEGQWGGEESRGSKGGNGLLYQTPEISNRPREFAWELWERHDKHQTQEYPMYALAYCAGKPMGSSVPGVEVERKEKSGTNYRGWRGGSACGVPVYVRATSPRPIVAIVHSLALYLTHHSMTTPASPC